MSRLERLLNLTAALLAAERPLTREELRERVAGYPPDKESFRRQFERDKDALRELGLPLRIVNLPGHDGDEAQVGYRIPGEEYYLRDPGLAADELAALHLAARVVRIEGLEDHDAVWKLGGEEASSGEDTAAATVTAATLPAGAVLAPVFAAIASGRRAHFSYRGEPRSVVPRTLSFRNGHWYLVGYDLDRQESRSFRTDRFTSGVEAGGPIDEDELAGAGAGAAATTGDAARRGEELLRPWELGAGPATTAAVLVDADQAAWAELHLGEKAVAERAADGSLTLTLEVRNTDAFRSFVLGFLDHAEVLAPPELREDVRQWLVGLTGRSG